MTNTTKKVELWKPNTQILKNHLRFVGLNSNEIKISPLGLFGVITCDYTPCGMIKLQGQFVDVATYFHRNITPLAFLCSDYFAEPYAPFFQTWYNATLTANPLEFNGKWGKIALSTTENTNEIQVGFMLYDIYTAKRMQHKSNNINHNKASDAETQADAEKKAFIKAAKKVDLLDLITSLSIVNTEYDDNKELTKLFVEANIHSDYINFAQDVDFVELLTNDYSADSEEKKSINKLLQAFVTTYRNKTKDITTAITHSNIHVCIKTDEKHYSVLKKFNLSIFDIIKIDTMTELHTVLKSNAFNKACPVSDILNSLIKELQDKIKKTVENKIKPVYIDNREFKRMLMKCTLKAGKIQCTYNKSNVQNFISGYVIASYNGRLKKFVSELKATK